MTANSNAASTPPIRVLIVEDERVVARDIKDCLEALGYEVLAMVASGEAAIVKARQLRPDVVLMDIRLEGEMDGTEAGQIIWHELQIPIIYATGYSDQATVDRATETEPFGYILKPIRERDLYIAIRTALQRHRQEVHLRQEYEYIATILTAIGDGVIVTDAQSRVRFLNLVAELLTGWQLQEAINRPLLDIFLLLHEQTQQPIDNPVAKVLQTGKTIYLVDPALLVTKDGRHIPIADSAAPLKDEAGNMTGVVVVFRDIREQPLIQERTLALQRVQLLEQQLEEIQQLIQQKDDFLSTVSHELRSPLANIKMSIHLLERNLDQRNLLSKEVEAEINAQSEPVARYLRILHEQCDQELALVNDLLEIQRLDAQAVAIDITSIDLSEWIPQVTEAYQDRMEARPQYLQILLPPNLSPLASDISILTRVLGELLTNACKYTPPEETITVSAAWVGDRLQLAVSNSGVAIPADELPKIFDKFYRVPGGDRWHQGGTGLGLALAKKQITYLGGRMWAESDAHEVRLTIELPSHPPQPSNWQ
jgi:hypothetical protein